MLPAIQLREAVHLLILRTLVRSVGTDSFVVKGGINLRCFFGSVRYSEDMDLDGEPGSRHALRSVIADAFTDRDLLDRARRLGIRALDPGEGPNKDTRRGFEGREAWDRIRLGTAGFIEEIRPVEGT